jgi:hypothetical protein
MVTVDFSGNTEITLRPALFGPETTVAYLHDMELSSIHEDVFMNAIALEEVYLSGNFLQTLPIRLFHNNPALRVVVTTDNPLEIPFRLCDHQKRGPDVAPAA